MTLPGTSAGEVVVYLDLKVDPGCTDVSKECVLRSVDANHPGLPTVTVIASRPGCKGVVSQRSAPRSDTRDAVGRWRVRSHLPTCSGDRVSVSILPRLALAVKDPVEGPEGADGKQEECAEDQRPHHQDGRDRPEGLHAGSVAEAAPPPSVATRSSEEPGDPYGGTLTTVIDRPPARPATATRGWPLATAARGRWSPTPNPLAG